jgi:hypothetical protein
MATDVHGFAVGEVVVVYSGSIYAAHSNGPTDKGGNGGNAGGLGPFTVIILAQRRRQL